MESQESSPNHQSPAQKSGSRATIVSWKTLASLFVTVNHRPVGPLDGRAQNFDDNVVGTCGRSDQMSGSQSSMLPRIILHQPSAAVVNVDSNTSRIGIGSGAKPVIIPFEKGMGNRLLLLNSKVTTPLVVPHQISLFHVGVDGFHGSGNGIIHRGQTFAAQCQQTNCNDQLSHNRALSIRIDSLNHVAGDFVNSLNSGRCNPLANQRRDLVQTLLDLAD